MPARLNPNSPGRDSAQVYVFQEGINVVPIVTSPRIVTQGYYVLFNASESYVVNCSRNMMIKNFSVGDLNCSYILAPGEKKPNQGKVYFKWEISEDGKITWKGFPSEQGHEWNETNYNSFAGVVFNWRFYEPKERYIRLSMNYTL